METLRVSRVGKGYADTSFCVAIGMSPCLKPFPFTVQTVLTEETTHAFLAFETVRWASARDASTKAAVNSAIKELQGAVTGWF